MKKQFSLVALLVLLIQLFTSGDSYAGCKLPGGWTLKDSCPVIKFEGNNPLDSSGKPYTDSCLKYTWNFGDSSSSAIGRTVSHTYSKNGTYTVCLKIQDLCRSCDTTICKTVTISCFGSSKCKLPTGWSSRDSCPVYQFEGNNPLDSSGKPFSDPCLKYSWNFGDGYTANGRMATHTYTKGGTYTVCMKVRDTCKGCDTTICKTISVTCLAGCKLPKNWSFKDSCTKLSFEGSNPLDSAGKPYTDSCLQYNWSFGDSSTAIGRLATHTYATTGTYIVCLKITDKCRGCDTTICKSVTVTCIGSGSRACNFPTGWSSTSDSCSNRTFEGWYPRDAASKPYIDTCQAYLWSFGDSSVAKGRVVAHHFKKIGTYNVCLTIVDLCNGCDTTICGTIAIPCFSPAATNIQSFTANAKDLRVYPNPAQNQFTLVAEGQQQYRVWDAFGKEIARGQFTDSATVPSGDWSTGIYTIQCIGADGASTTRLLISR